MAWEVAEEPCGELQPYGLPPDTKGSGDFKRLLDRRAKSAMPDCYWVSAPAYLRRMDPAAPDRVLAKGPCDCRLSYLMKYCRTSSRGRVLQRCCSNGTNAPNYDTHPVVREGRAANRPPAVPLSIFIDGVAYAKKDSLLVISLCNLLTDRRVVLAVLRKRLLCKCSCRGWGDNEGAPGLVAMEFAGSSRGLIPRCQT